MSADVFLVLYTAVDTMANSRCSANPSRVVTDLGAKTRVMELMTHENSDVRYRALLSVQQLVSQPWLTA